MATWAEHIRAGNLTVKGKKANEHQAQMMALITQRTQAKGGDLESAAGAIATAIQESGVTNINFGDRDSLGLYQQRPSMGWGTAAQITTPSYAVDKFLSIYLPYRRQGLGWLTASHKTQRSAHPNAPAPWYGEAMRAARHFAGVGGLADVSGVSGDGGGSFTETRDLPYEFSRGTADRKEDSWTCIGRLADEVGWRRYVTNGGLWYVSDNWLSAHPPIARISETSRGVLSLSFEFETRKDAAEATLRIVIGRYALKVGDIVEIVDEGPADGKWIVATTRRDLTSNVLELTLTRPVAKLPEPAPQTESVTVGGMEQSVGGGGADLGGDGSLASKVYAAAQRATSFGWVYRLTQRTLVQRPPSADCSSGVSWVLLSAGVPLPGGASWGKWAPVSGNFLGWGQSGRGQRVTVWTNAGHIWLQFHGFPMFRFDTGGGSGGKLHSGSRSSGGFTARHWAGM